MSIRAASASSARPSTRARSTASALGDGMYGQSLIDAMGDEHRRHDRRDPRCAEGEGSAKFAEAAKAAGLDPTSSYTGESYDAAALIALAMQKAGSTDRTAIRDADA
jgi:branched-chain amino acid transport system substrate-binding protein